jgi:hypothetical protein
MTLVDYAQELVDYLCKKIPDINPATAIEIAEFATMKAGNYAQDEIKANNKSWYDSMKKHDEFLHMLYERK